MNNKKNFKIAGDLFYTIMATVVMNIVLQIVIYPLINNFYGSAVTGEILYFIGFIYIIPQALGTALSNTRLVIRKNSEASNSDFSHVILISSIISALTCGIIGFIENTSFAFCVSYALFSVLYLLRIYAQVEFRLTLRFKEHFLYYCIISVGYLLGFVLFMITKIWLFIFVIGEAAALIYSLVKGNIFKKGQKSVAISTINKTIVMVAMSTLMRDCVLHFDKVILKQTINADVVTQYHAVSLIAKTMQMLIQPINTLILSYLSVKDSVLSKKTLFKFVMVSLALSCAFYGVCIIGTPIFLKLFYPSLYADAILYNYIVNLGLILSFVASLFMAVLLSQGETRLYTTIECISGTAYIIGAYYFSSLYAVWGLAYATLIVNIIKVISTIICLFISTNKKEN